MDAALLARIQFAVTVGFHFLFPPVTIGMAWVIVWMTGKWRKTGDEFWKRLARFWIKIFSISFAVGVATGITMEFQFGTNWAEYSKFVGDIFGAPLAAEGVLAFFLESTFLGVLLFGWKKFGARTMWFSALMVAVGSTLSAFWIIVANSWMQTPAGYHIVNGRAELTDFWAAVFNPSTMPRYVHTVTGALVTGSFFILGLSAWFLLKKRHLEFAKSSLRIALIWAFVASFLQLGAGHWHGMQVAATQPVKLAAGEGIFETQRGAPLLLFGIPNYEEERIDYAVQIPKLLSWLAFADFDAEVKGLKDVPKEEWPPLGLTFYPFHLMIALGMFFIAFTAFGVFLLWRKKVFENRFFLRLALLAVPLPFLANELGWITAEVGRQPWIVQGVMKTNDAISRNVSANEILASLILFGLIYAFLFVCWVYLLRRTLKKGPEEAPPSEPGAAGGEAGAAEDSAGSAAAAAGGAA